VTAALAEEVAGRTVWNLLPNEHAAAWAPTLDGGPAAPGAVISVKFFDTVERNGRRELVAVAHWNKLLKGALVAHVVAGQLTSPDQLAGFDHPLGYRFVPDLTTVAPDGITRVVALVKP
jgi:hypothetical protein